MTSRPRPLRLLSVLGLAGLAAACGLSQDVPASGSVGVSFIGIGKTNLSALDYEVSGNGIKPIAGTISLADINASASAIIGGLPVGSGYELVLDGTSDDGQDACHGAALFDVAANQTSTIQITLTCFSGDAPVRTTTVNGMTDYCPALASYAASPPVGIVGGAPLSLTATAFSYYTDPLRFEWRSSSGDLSSLHTAVSTFRCTQPGITTIIVTVTDGYCPDSAALDVTCLAALPDASSDGPVDCRCEDGGIL